ncbi:MAG: metallophosphoesterase family protein [Spirochaetaceae bacterium]|nr:metallophosphoesterase family protein [Spirochaetaceae bacterium]
MQKNLYVIMSDGHVNFVKDFMVKKNKIKQFFIEKYLDSLLSNSKALKINAQSKIVIFSDLHIGRRNRKDDFLNNSSMFMHLLEHYYLPCGYTLILNGDIEELQRNSFYKVREKWPDLYALFNKFDSEERLYKITGNHDIELYKYKDNINDINSKIFEAMILDFEGNSILVFHGHQASMSFILGTALVKYGLRYIAQPLGIKNFTRSYNNPRIHKVEQFVYDFSSKRKIISIIGHTHRPLFESLSEVDLLRYKIERLLRVYPEKNSDDPKIVKKIESTIEDEIRKHKEQIKKIYEENNEYRFKSSLYDHEFVIPSIFNSGSVIGKKGFTAIEISDNNISLVHYFDSRKKVKNYSYSEERITQIEDTSYYKTVLKEDSLSYIFRRIKFLA